jgi:hypothetical protein
MPSSRLRGNAAKTDEIVRNRKRVSRLPLPIAQWSRLQADYSQALLHVANRSDQRTFSEAVGGRG